MDFPAPSPAPTRTEGGPTKGSVPTTLPTSTISTSNKAGFFSDTFPRELRDEIYDRLYDHHEFKSQTKDHWNAIDYCLTTPLVALRLVSRQFKLEYDDRCLKNKHLSHLLVEIMPLSRLDDDDDDDDDYNRYNGTPFFKFTGPATHATNMTIVLPHCNCNPQHDSIGLACTHDNDRIIALTNPMQHLRCVQIYLKVPERSCVHAVLLHRHYNTTAIKAFKGSWYDSVFEFKMLYPGCETVKGGNNKILATWSKQRGLEIEDEAVKQGFAQASVELEQRMRRPLVRRGMAMGPS